VRRCCDGAAASGTLCGLSASIRPLFPTLVAAGLALAGCRTPTSITLTINGDIRCEDLKGVAIATGTRDAIESAAPTTTTTKCSMNPDGTTRVGSLVIVPSGANDAEIAIRVTAGIDRPVEECTAANNYAGCVVVRRVIRFEPHTELDLPVRLALNCKDVACDATTTCVNSRCRNATDLSVPEVDAGPTDTGSDTPVTPDAPVFCTDGQKNCDGKCVAITDPAYGCSPASCSPCGGPGATSSYVCDTGACKENGCAAGLKDCGGACVSMDPAHGCSATSCTPCASDNGVATCEGGACKLTCNTGYKLCGGRCVNVGDPTYGCGATTCSSAGCPTGGTVVCSGGACVLGSCPSGTKACSGKCVPTDTTNGCGDVARCTPCAAGESCVGGPPTTCQCVPEAKSVTCSRVQCGITQNNCGQSVDCGTAACAAPKTCGGGGTANVCGCTLTTSPCDGVSCGTLTDSCGNSVSCGCTGTNTCGGGGVAGKCGCTPINPCVGGVCGAFSNGCGAEVACSCTSPQTCGGGGTPGVCGCKPLTIAEACDFQVCGPAPDGCGGTLSCGSCGTGKCCFDTCVCKTCYCP